jgi:hypothetical protein
MIFLINIGNIRIFPAAPTDINFQSKLFPISASYDWMLILSHIAIFAGNILILPMFIRKIMNRAYDAWSSHWSSAKRAACIAS